MATIIIAALILGAAGYILGKKVMKMKRGDFSCEGCKGGACSGCSRPSEKSDLAAKNNKDHK